MRDKRGNFVKGHIMTEEVRRKISLAGKGRVTTEEAKRKIGLANKGRKPFYTGTVGLKKVPEGWVPWNKGKKLSDEIRKKLSDAHKNKPLTEKQIEGHRLRGIRLRELSKLGLGRKMSKENRQKLREANVGRKLSVEHCQKLRLIKLGKYCGEENSQWKGGITPFKHKIRGSPNYRQWVSDVYKRDYWTCQTCNKKGGIKIEAHHIKKFLFICEENNIQTYEQAMDCKELWDINNGVTLCVDCHKLTRNRRRSY